MLEHGAERDTRVRLVTMHCAIGVLRQHVARAPYTPPYDDEAVNPIVNFPHLAKHHMERLEVSVCIIGILYFGIACMLDIVSRNFLHVGRVLISLE